MRIAALYGSKYGQTERVVRRISDVLASEGHTVEVLKGDRLPSGFELERFDAVLLGASIIRGRHQSYIRKFVVRHADQLAHMPTAFVSVSGTSPESLPEWRHAARGYVDQFLSRTGWRPSHTAMFSGALCYTRYDPLTRWVMKRLSKRSGAPTDTSRDYDFTDWAAVDRFAHVLREAWEPAREPA